MPPHPKLEPEDFDPDFLNNHLRRAPPKSLNKTTRKEMTEKAKNIDGFYQEPYALLASLLNTMSEALYNTLSSSQKDKLRRRHRVPPRKFGHLTFVDHHASRPTRFPKKAVDSTVDDQPSFFGVYDIDDFEYDNDPHPAAGRENHRIYKGIPYHRIETIVSVKLADEMDCCKKVITYAGHYHQARPDRPSVLCLIAQDGGYQIIYSDPNGVVASEITEWHDLDLLAAYVYSLYLPPSGHFLWDDTIQRVPGATATSMPTWNVKLKTQWYENGQLIFSGDGWGRRTTIFRAIDKAGNWVMIKEMFRDVDNMMKEEDMLEQVHCDGDVPGVVRMLEWAEVTSGGKVMKFINTYRSLKKIRIVLLDSGSSLLKAKSVNDLLKAVYDALEVHRTLFIERRVLHRDMSAYNILMYPQQNHCGNNVLGKADTFIENLLQGTKTKNPVSPACLVIDFDHATSMDDAGREDTLAERIGTPMFIARSVSLAQTLYFGLVYSGKKMPLLQGDALDLYLKLHGKKRYNRYNDKGQSCHGGIPPTRDPTDYTSAELIEFKHRAEHDVESIYWTLVYTLLSVHPKGEPEEKLLSQISSDTWQSLLTHKVPALDHNNPAADRRTSILDYHLIQWTSLFSSKMMDVAVLLLKISLHVRSEYAMWQGKLQPDHLHEALQRIILQYLVDHRDKDIQLDPNIRRPRPNPYASGEAALKPDLRNDLNKDRTGKSGARTTGNGADAAGAQSLFQQQGARSGKRTQGTGGGKTGHRNGTINDDQPWALPARTSAKRKTDELDEPAEGGRKSKRRKTIPDVNEGQDGSEHIGNGEQGGSEQGGSGQPGSSDAATNAAPDRHQPSTGVRTRSGSKRKSNESDAPAEEPRRSKRLKANPDMGCNKDAGKSEGVTSAAAAGGLRDEPSAGVRTKLRSKRDYKEPAGKPVERTRSSQRIKDAAAKKASENKEAEPRPTVKKSVRRTRSRA